MTGEVNKKSIPGEEHCGQKQKIGKRSSPDNAVTPTAEADKVWY